MSEQKDAPLDKGCMVGIVACAIFLMVPIVAWWIPVALKCVEWLARLVGLKG